MTTKPDVARLPAAEDPSQIPAGSGLQLGLLALVSWNLGSWAEAQGLQAGSDSRVWSLRAPEEHRRAWYTYISMGHIEHTGSEGLSALTRLLLVCPV